MMTRRAFYEFWGDRNVSHFNILKHFLDGTQLTHACPLKKIRTRDDTAKERAVLTKERCWAFTETRTFWTSHDLSYEIYVQCIVYIYSFLSQGRYEDSCQSTLGTGYNIDTKTMLVIGTHVKVDHEIWVWFSIGFFSYPSHYLPYLSLVVTWV